jgi:F0F1-type ATP synthase epsilon subunit
MRDNVLTILTTEATAAEEVDYNKAKEAYEKALAQRVTDEKTAAAREHDLAKARAMQAVAGQK